jgi:hypothetical protein
MMGSYAAYEEMVCWDVVLIAFFQDLAQSKELVYSRFCRSKIPLFKNSVGQKFRRLKDPEPSSTKKNESNSFEAI